MNIRGLYNIYLSKDKKFAKHLYRILGFVPNDLHLYKLAFYNRSGQSNEQGRMQNNERLEYLGDAILGSIAAEYLYAKYPHSDEGFLTKMRSKMVKRSSLNLIADHMGLDMMLTEYNNSRPSKTMLGNCLEALVGAIYLETGYKSTKKYVINKILRRYINIQDLEDYDDNFKSQLLEWGQKHGKIVTFAVVTKFKLDKRDRFKVAVLVDGLKVGVADDFNKKSAEQLASERALLALGVTGGNSEPAT